MIVETCKQYSSEYWMLKLGKPSSSMFSKLVTSTGNKSASWLDAAYKLAAEIVTGKPEETFQSEYMSRGLEMETEARLSYEFVTGNKEMGHAVGVVYPDDKKLWCCSPDWLYETKGLEIKCPSAGVHMRYLHENKIPTKYKPQVFGSLWLCDEIDSWNFYSYHPEIKPLNIVVERDNKEFQEYSKALEKYLPDMVEFIKEVAGV